MRGFFTESEVKSDLRPDGKTYSCASCGKIKGAHSPRMKPYGNFKKKILCIGGLPSKTEDQKGKPWQDSYGYFLFKALQELGIDLFEDCISFHAIHCHTTKNVGSYDVACCRKTVVQYIKEYQPKVILLFGDLAVESFLGIRWKKDLGSIDKWRGWIIPDQDYRAWVCPLFHPNRIADATKEYQTIWKQDLKKAIIVVNTLFPKYVKPEINYIEDLSIFETIKGGVIAFDYETTGLKPHKAGHRIICASVAVSSNEVYVFMMPETKKQRKPFLDLLSNPNVGKVAQNMKFENYWSSVRLKTSVNNWLWDTMLMSHILDNRKDITGLKFQTYVNFGIIDYSSEVSGYLVSSGKDGNEMNNILELVKTNEGREKLMTYCALDSIYEYRLFQLQKRLLDYDDLPF